MNFCPECNAFLTKNRNSTRDERLCPECGWKGCVWLEDGKKFGQCDKVSKHTNNRSQGKDDYEGNKVSPI
jgi:hypothetical protein